MSDTQQLLKRFDALVAKTDTSPSTLSRKLFGNGKRIDEIKAGGSLTMTTYEKAIQLLDALERSAAQ